MSEEAFSGKRILVIGGNPRERVDTFRFYYNDIRPEEQAAIAAKTLTSQGAEVVFLSPASNRYIPEGVQAITTCEGRKIESAKDICKACRELDAAGRFDGVLQLANISSITCPNPSSVKIQKTDVSTQGQLFTVAGNIDIAGRLETLFPQAAIAGYDSHQQMFRKGDAALGEALMRVAEASVPVAEASPAPPQAATLPRVGKLSGRKIIVTTARTEEVLTQGGDKITNFFSGRQGQAIATACADMGAEVTLISGPTHLPDVAHPNVKTVHVVSARQMYEAAQAALSQPTDAFIGAAAVADFGVETPAALALKEGETHRLELTENPNIVGGAAKHASRPRVVVSFAAQSPETIEAYAVRKFHKLGADLTVANPIGDTTVASRDPSRNQVMLITRDGIRRLEEMSKEEVAGRIADEVATLLLKSRPVAPADAARGHSSGNAR